MGRSSRSVRCLDEVKAGVAQLAMLWGGIWWPSHRDAGAPLAKRFGNEAGRTTGSCRAAVVIVAEVDGVLVEPSSRLGDLSARLGCSAEAFGC